MAHGSYKRSEDMRGSHGGDRYADMRIGERKREKMAC